MNLTKSYPEAMFHVNRTIQTEITEEGRVFRVDGAKLSRASDIELFVLH